MLGHVFEVYQADVDHLLCVSPVQWIPTWKNELHTTGKFELSITSHFTKHILEIVRMSESVQALLYFGALLQRKNIVGPR